MHRLISPGGRKEEMQCLMPLDQEMKSERVWIEKHQGGWERKDPIIAKMICHRMSNADGRTWQMINTAARVIVQRTGIFGMKRFRSEFSVNKGEIGPELQG